jgi:hypothetical protein
VKHRRPESHMATPQNHVFSHQCVPPALLDHSGTGTEVTFGEYSRWVCKSTLLRLYRKLQATIAKRAGGGKTVGEVGGRLSVQETDIETPIPDGVGINGVIE